MAFLKQSLMAHSSIAVHEAIVEQTSDTGSIISIILPYASLGDLAQFLLDQTATDEHRPAQPGLENPGLVQGLMTQSAQLAGALKFLHEGFPTETGNWKLCCAHLDLKPSNIIIFKPEYGESPVGKWKLCDFGISVFQAEQNGHPKDMVSIGDFYLGVLDKTMRVRPQRLPGVYQAPEVEHHASPWNSERHMHNVGRSSDVWSFAAIFSEVLAYAIGRSDDVKAFRKSRTCKSPINGRMVTNDFFYTSLDDDVVDPSSTLRYITRPEVADWLGKVCDKQQVPGSGVCFGCWATCIKCILKVSADERPPTGVMAGWIEQLQTHGNSAGSSHVSFDLYLRKTRDAQESTRHSSSTTTHLSLSAGHQPSTDSIRLKPSTSVDILTGKDLRHFSIPSPFAIDDVISHHIDGRNVAYLTKDSVELCRLLSSAPRDFTDRDLYMSIPVRRVGCIWKGLHLSYPYLVIWGLSDSQPDVGPQSSVQIETFITDNHSYKSMMCLIKLETLVTRSSAGEHRDCRVLMVPNLW